MYFNISKVALLIISLSDYTITSEAKTSISHQLNINPIVNQTQKNQSFPLEHDEIEEEIIKPTQRKKSRKKRNHQISNAYHF